MFLRSCVFIYLLSASASAFAPSKLSAPLTVHGNVKTKSPPSSSPLILFSENKKKGGLDGNMKTRLLSESIAPWRTLRLFLYGSLGSGAFIGGLINISGAIAGSNSPDFNLNTELLNVGIDFGALALFIVLGKFDVDQGSELETKVDEKIQIKKESKQVTKGMEERQKGLRSLPLDILVSSEGATRKATVGELQVGAKQHMIIVAGPKKACRDALLGANLLKMDFAMSNVIVVPYETGLDSAEGKSRPSGGFSDRPMYETQPYIARASGEDWAEYIKSEMADAMKQSGNKANEEGIAIVIASNGKIIRRGVGTVPWRQMVEQLELEVNPSPEGPLPWLKNF